MTPSQPPDHTIGIVATSASLRLPCLRSTRRKARSARRGGKSVTPPLPSVFPTTATTWSAVNCPARMRSSRPDPSWTLLSSTFATSTAIVWISLLYPSPLHADPLVREVDAQDRRRRVRAGPLGHRGSRVVRRHAGLADVGQDVLVTERNVVPAGVANLVGENRRGPIRPLAVRIEEPVNHRPAPALSLATWNIGERLEARLVLLHRP